MRNPFLVLLFFFLVISCQDKIGYGDLHPDLMKPKWDNVKSDKLKFKIGDVISIYPDKYCYLGVILDFDKDESGIWYGISLSNYRWISPNKKKINDLDFFGRRISSGFTGDFIDCFDLVYINEKTIDKRVHLVKNVKVDINKISIGSIYPITNLRQIETEYVNGVKERRAPNKVVERYFKIENILLK